MDHGLQGRIEIWYGNHEGVHKCFRRWLGCVMSLVHRTAAPHKLRFVVGLTRLKWKINAHFAVVEMRKTLLVLLLEGPKPSERRVLLSRIRVQLSGRYTYAFVLLHEIIFKTVTLVTL